MRSMNRLGGSRIALKIALPMVLLLLGTALVAGPVARTWVSDTIEAGAMERLVEHRSMAAEVIEDAEGNLALFARLIADSVRVRKAFGSRDSGALVRELLPFQVATGAGLAVAVDSRGRVLASTSGRYRPGQSLAWMPVVQKALTGMNVVDLVGVPRGAELVGGAPVHSPTGDVGAILVGTLSLQPVLDKIKATTRSDVVVCTPYRKMGGTFRRPDPDIRVPRDVCMRIEETGAPFFGSATINGRPYRVVYFPVILHGEVVATGGIFSSAEDVVAAEETVTRDVIALNGILLAIVALVAYLVARGITRPLGRLVAAARRIADGDLSEDVEAATADEVGDLAEAFGTMTESLRARTDDLTRRMIEQQTLYDLSRILGSTLDLSELLSVMLNTTMKVFDAEMGNVLLIDEDTGELESMARLAPMYGEVAEGEGEADLAETMAEWVARDGKPLLFGRGGDDGLLARFAAPARSQCAMCVPLQLHERTVGVVAISTTKATSVFTEDSVQLLSTIAGQAAVSIENARLFARLQEAYLSTVRALAAAVDAKDPYTRGHSEEVAKYATMIADQLDFSEQHHTALVTAAYLHDIGKIGVSDEVLHKPSRLSEREMNSVRHHCMIAANILSPIPFPWKVTSTVRHHHERYDGAGYPAGLSGEEIPLDARILTVADSYDAMISDRPYRRGMTSDEAIVELEHCAGTQFDPALVEQFVKALREARSRRASEPREPVVAGQERQEGRAIFVSIGQSLMQQYGKLGGSRVAKKLEDDLNTYLSRRGCDIHVAEGQFDIGMDHKLAVESETELYRQLLSKEVSLISNLVGDRIAQQIYLKALDGLTKRFRGLAERYGFDRVVG